LIPLCTISPVGNAPHAGAWIETPPARTGAASGSGSHPVRVLQLVRIHAPDLLRLHAQVVQRLPLRTVIINDHELWQPDTKRHALVIPPGQSTDLIEKLLELMKSILASGEDLVISRFGKFYVLEKESEW